MLRALQEMPSARQHLELRFAGIGPSERVIDKSQRRIRLFDVFLRQRFRKAMLVIIVHLLPRRRLLANREEGKRRKSEGAPLAIDQRFPNRRYRVHERY